MQTALTKALTDSTGESLDSQYFNSRGDFNFPRLAGESQIRGGLLYMQPSSRWFRIGLNVTKDNYQWLSMDGRSGEWAVGFHGVSSSGSSSLHVLAKIIKTKTITLARNNGYGGSKARNRADPVPRVGIYLSKNVENCYISQIRINNIMYDIAVQCRVNPDHVWEIAQKEWFVVDSSEQVRPYGIVLRRR